MNELTGKVAVVTGGSGGSGTAIIDALASAGATAVNLDIAPVAPIAPSDPHQPPTSNLQSERISCDVRDDASVASAIAAVAERHGRIDIAVHAAGISRDAVVWKLAVEQWDIVRQVNLRGAFLLLRHVIPVKIREQAVAETHLGELVEPEDIAAAVVFLSGPGARRMTGQILRVDAGQYL